MNIRNVLDALKLYVGESKDSEHQTFVKPRIFLRYLFRLVC
jgi:hypothetical protein